ncbi:hypothetical protein MLD38_020385 [Melastoma candidum]|nr:hypothetical protein MLD38_020385 [Melastoma candidum]
MLKTCSGLGDIKLGRQLHAHITKSVFGHHLISQNALIAMYNKLNSINEAYIVFCYTEEKDLISWGSMIAGFSQLHHEMEALECFREMLLEGVHQPNEFIFGSLFSACGSIANAEYGRQIHVTCVKFGLMSNNFSGCALCDMYSKSGLMDSAATAFQHIERPDVISWNALIGGYAHKGDGEAAISFFSRMRCMNIVPDDITVRLLLCACTGPASLPHGMQIHSYITKVGFNVDIAVCNGLLSMYAKCSGLVDVFNVFEEVSRYYDLVSWNTTLVACMQHNEPMEVFRLFKALRNSAISPDYITMTSIIGAYAVFASLEMGSQVHCYVMKTGLFLDTSVANGLMDMYVKCGSLEVAQKIFGYVENPDVISWSCLIMAHAQFGFADEALRLFEEMKSRGLTPNEITLVSVLSACSHVGMVEKGWEVYRTMESEFGIRPTKEHCSCMIDLLARAGLLHEARDFINQMGYSPDIVAWKTLLSASRSWKNIEIGKWAAESILTIDPSHSAAHVLLSNIYASSGSWDEVARLRNLMKENKVQKTPGQSWIEIKSRIHAFLAEDSLHPERDKIYAVMDELWLQLLDHGDAAPKRRVELDEVSIG